MNKESHVVRSKNGVVYGMQSSCKRNPKDLVTDSKTLRVGVGRIQYFMCRFVTFLYVCLTRKYVMFC